MPEKPSPSPPSRRPDTLSPAAWFRPAAAAALVALLAGCAGGATVPESIRNPATATPVTVGEVQTDPNRHVGQRVRWGGSIIAVNNHERSTDVEVLALPLEPGGAPRSGASAQGRFLARVQGFLDPAEYPKDRELTVVGMLTGVETRRVGEYPYSYPVLQVEARHLWPEPQPPSAYPVPGPWLNPWYDPWWPWYGPPGLRPVPWYW